MKITIEVDAAAEKALQALAELHGWSTPADAVRYLVASAADGVRRPGSWERGWLAQAFPMDNISGGD